MSEITGQLCSLYVLGGSQGHMFVFGALLDTEEHGGLKQW